MAHPPHPEPQLPHEPVKFDAAIAAWRKRDPMPKADWEALQADERDYAWTVAGVAQADVVSDVWDAIDSSVEKGTPFAEFKADVGAKLEEAWGGEKPGRLECLPGDNDVSGAVVRAAHRRRYEGNVCEVVTDHGRSFTTTPNHPMLTRNGWRATGQLRQGDYLIGYDRKQNLGPRGDEDEAHPPASVAQVFEAIARAGIVERVHAHPFDFHGDGVGSDVDVVRPAGTLRVGSFAALRKPLEHQLFARSSFARPRFCRACGHLAIVTKRCGFCDRPVRHAGALQALTDRIVARAQGLSDGVRALASLIASHDLVHGQILALPRWLAAAGEVKSARITERPRHARCLNDLPHPSVRLSHRSGDGPDAQASEIEFDRVRSIRIHRFSGHVFNLSTAHGYFGLSGLYTGNTIFRTNVNGAYNEGRHSVFTAPKVLEARPYWRYELIDDSDLCDICQDCKGVILPADDEWWSENLPPLHFRCRCSFTALSREEANDEGIDAEGPDTDPDEGFGEAPSEKGTDWADPDDYAPPIGDVLDHVLDR